MRKLFLVIALIMLSLGCARLSVQGAKEPIKVDITMRLDIYQHVVKDIDAIEDIVSGGKDTLKPAGPQSYLGLFVGTAYAQEGLSPQVEQAALRRKDRINELYALESQGAVGENKNGQLEERVSSADSVKKLIAAENSDRMLIYNALAVKNSTSVEEIQKIYAERMRANAPAGTPIEVLNQSGRAYEWKKK